MAKILKKLHHTFKPDTYHLDIFINFSENFFKAHLAINGQKIGRPSKRITLHSHKQKILAAEVIRHDKKGDQVFVVSRINKHKSYEQLRLHSTETLFPGYYTIRLHFEGQPSRSSVIQEILNTNIIDAHLGGELRKFLPSVDEIEASCPININIVGEPNFD